MLPHCPHVVTVCGGGWGWITKEGKEIPARMQGWVLLKTNKTYTTTTAAEAATAAVMVVVTTSGEKINGLPSSLLFTWNDKIYYLQF